MRATFAHGPKTVAKQLFIGVNGHYCLNAAVKPFPEIAIVAIIAENNIRCHAWRLPVPNITIEKCVNILKSQPNNNVNRTCCMERHDASHWQIENNQRLDANRNIGYTGILAIHRDDGYTKSNTIE